MNEFKKYRRNQIAEMRDLDHYEYTWWLLPSGISVSDEDKKLPRSEFILGKIARNPDNHADQWYVNPVYFAKNFEPIEP